MRHADDDLADLLAEVRRLELIAARMTRMMGEMTQLLDMLQLLRQALWKRLRCDAEAKEASPHAF